MVNLMFVGLLSGLLALSSSSGAVSSVMTRQVSLDDSSVLDDLSAMPGFSESDYPLDSSQVQNRGANGDIRLITVSDGAASFSKAYFYVYHPSGLKLAYWDGIDYSQAGGFRVNISVSPDHADASMFSRRKVVLLSSSPDYRFWKFRLDGSFGFSSYSQRVYDISSFDVLDSESKRSNAYTVGQRLLATGGSEGRAVVNSSISVYRPEVYAWNYAIPGKNNHSGDSWGGDNFHEEHNCYSVVYSLGFNVPKDLGACKGLRLSWEASQIYTPGDDPQNLSGTVMRIDGVSPVVNERNFFVSDPALDLPGYDSSKLDASWLYKLANAWGTDQSGDWRIPAFQKIVPLLGGGLYTGSLTAGATQLSNPYLLSEIAASSIGSLFDPLKDVYVCHFDVRDLIFTSEITWSDFFQDLIPFYNIWFAINYIVNNKGEHYSWSMSDVSPLELYMERNGVSYVLPVSADSQYITHAVVLGSPDASGIPPWVIWALVVGGAVVAVLVVNRFLKFLRGKD